MFINKIYLLLAFCLITFLVSAQSPFDQNLELEKTEWIVGELLDTVQSKTALKLSYGTLDENRKINLSSKNLTLREILDQTFQNSQYQSKDGKILIFPKTKNTNKKATINGFILDEETGEFLIGALFFDPANSTGVATNNFGFYSLTLPLGVYSLQSSYVGFQNQQLTIDLKKDTTFNILLTQEMLDEVIITSEKEDPITQTTQMGTFNVQAKQIKNRPVILGESDVMKTLQLLPGVQSGNEGSSGLYVRGGGPDQNLVLIDGIPTYNLTHLFGFLSTVNTDAINDVKLVKGAFPARYGGRLSSVVDISLKEGNSKEFHGAGNVGLLSSSLTLEGPIKNEKTSYIVSARRTILDLFLEPFMRPKTTTNEDSTPTSTTTTDPDAGYYFYDVSGKINHHFSAKDRIYLSTYLAKDKGHQSSRIDRTQGETTSQSFDQRKIEWASAIGAFRWNHIMNEKLFSNLTLSYSKFSFEASNEVSFFFTNPIDTIRSFDSYETQSNIQDWSAKLDFDFIPSPKHYFRLGTNFIRHSFAPNVIAIQENTDTEIQIPSATITADELTAYIEDDMEISPAVKANLGVHVSGFQVDNALYHSIQPRASIRYLFNDRFSIKASYSQMAQFLNMLTQPTVGLPTDFWVPSTEHVKPQESKQISLGAYYLRTENDLTINIEGYYKKMNHLIEYKQGASYLNPNQDWQEKITAGSGESYGAEFFVQKSFGKTDGWVGYTLSWANRHFVELNHGRPFPYKFDRRHDIKVVVNHELENNVFLSFNWVFATGNAITLPQSSYSKEHDRYDTDNYTRLLDYKGKNEYNLRPYHRLDVSIRFYKKKKWGERNWIFGVYNAYNQNNTFYISQNRDSYTIYNNTGLGRGPSGTIYSIKENYLFPILPSISYQFNF